MDQFPHDADPKGAAVPKGVRLIHARDAGPFVQLALSPVIGERHTLSTRQTLAIMREMAQALHKTEACTLTKDLLDSVEEACEVWRVATND